MNLSQVGTANREEEEQLSGHFGRLWCGTPRFLSQVGTVETALESVRDEQWTCLAVGDTAMSEGGGRGVGMAGGGGRELKAGRGLRGR